MKDKAADAESRVKKEIKGSTDPALAGTDSQLQPCSTCSSGAANSTALIPELGWRLLWKEPKTIISKILGRWKK